MQDPSNVPRSWLDIPMGKRFRVRDTGVQKRYRVYDYLTI